LTTSGRNLLRSILPIVVAAPLRALGDIESIDFDTVPAGAILQGAQITLQGPTAVGGALDVSGTITLGSGSTIVFDPPRAGTLHLGAGDFGMAFQQDGPCFDQDNGWHALYIACPSSVNSGVAAVHLPAGAQLTDFRCWYYDNDETHDFMDGTGVTLFKLSDASLSSVVVLRTDDLTGEHEADARIEVVDSTFTPEVIDPEYHYYARFFWETTGPQSAIYRFRFYGCRIEYDVATWTP
jgi:hypothetical protein